MAKKKRITITLTFKSDAPEGFVEDIYKEFVDSVWQLCECGEKGVDNCNIDYFQTDLKEVNDEA